MVITGLTRNQFASNRTRVRIPHSPPFYTMKRVIYLVKIIGAPTEELAIDQYNKWKAERDQWNRESKKHDRILLLITLPICVVLMLAVAWMADWFTVQTDYTPFLAMGLMAPPIICGMILLFCWEGQWDYSASSWPMQYKYYIKTKDMSVLTSKIENGCLDLVLENAKHEVSSTSIGGFTQKIRTDVDEVTVDLENEEILIPYKNTK